MVDGDEQVAVQIVSARDTVEQTGQPSPTRDQSDCFVEPCLMQRLRDDVGKLEVERILALHGRCRRRAKRPYGPHR